MAGKKGTTKKKGKETKPAVSSDDGWKTSKCSEADLQSLIDECLLRSKEIIQWHAATGITSTNFIGAGVIGSFIRQSKYGRSVATDQ
ncbi:hypothetical protein C2845_PM14G10050 [Panicum miliaceum]|uniref:Uncharacterized protein n=1 Tax=Panicum miliaceum TaxID=4540 RepID=A0A3L6PNL6_PANMI|nr:hypothetical protein C2845_PM14G10050 [Panicum miliaceum]